MLWSLNHILSWLISLCDVSLVNAHSTNIVDSSCSSWNILSRMKLKEIIAVKLRTRMKLKEILFYLFACALILFFIERICVCFQKYLDKKEATSLQTFRYVELIISNFEGAILVLKKIQPFVIFYIMSIL